MRIPLKSTHGMATLPVLLALCFVFLVILTAVINQNIFFAHRVHQSLLRKQAEWLARSGIERAKLVIFDPDTRLTGPLQSQFVEPISPVYIQPDPLLEDTSDSKRIIPARYGYHIASIEPALLKSDETKAFLVTGFCEIPYRSSSIQRTYTHYFSCKRDGKWQIQALAPET